MTLLDLNPDQLLSTTRAVRKRIDIDRPVPDDLIRECAALALQAPSGSNQISMNFLVVKDAAVKAAVAAVYASCFEIYKTLPMYAGAIARDTDELQKQQDRVADSANFLADHMAEMPALLIACHNGNRIDNLPAMMGASSLGNILPATWSFMLAARARGLGTAWTTLHLMKEQEVAEIVGIPYETVQQVCLSPIGYTKGTDFKAAVRPDPETILHWDRW